MYYKIPIETSARHLHLCREDFEKLFGEGKDLTPVKELSQPGQYLAKERLNVIGPKGMFKNVAIIGPLRSVTQMEISVTDARKLGVPVVIRQSGDIDGTPGMTLVSDMGSVDLEEGIMVAKRHIHMTPKEARRMKVKDNEEVFVVTESFDRSMIYGDVVVRVSDDYRLAMHIDTDEANALSGGEEAFGVILKLFEGSNYNLHMWVEELLWGINR
ncbi:MAG: phosphate propanoyltransferase [Eubacterium sp.]|nr:phosphate propanoyltransferase [Eubacterium sp.]MCI6996607.1 phosphate propanoyltransferase [Eubacterium sp.]MDY2596545.1 phosphate propanoyltransferase [Oliverpabstia sp.]